MWEDKCRRGKVCQKKACGCACVYQEKVWVYIKNKCVRIILGMCASARKNQFMVSDLLGLYLGVAWGKPRHKLQTTHAKLKTAHLSHIVLVYRIHTQRDKEQSES